MTQISGIGNMTKIIDVVKIVGTVIIVIIVICRILLIVIIVMRQVYGSIVPAFRQGVWVCVRVCVCVTIGPFHPFYFDKTVVLLHCVEVRIGVRSCAMWCHEEGGLPGNFDAGEQRGRPVANECVHNSLRTSRMLWAKWSNT